MSIQTFCVKIKTAVQLIASIVLFIYLLNKIVLNIQVFKLKDFLAFFIFSFSL